MDHLEKYESKLCVVGTYALSLFASVQKGTKTCSEETSSFREVPKHVKKLSLLQKQILWAVEGQF